MSFSISFSLRFSFFGHRVVGELVCLQVQGLFWSWVCDERTVAVDLTVGNVVVCAKYTYVNLESS